VTREIQLVDTSLRDGNQSLWGATGLTTGMVEAVAPGLAAAGFRALDFTSSTHLAVGVRWHRENPWERIGRMAAAAGDAPLSLITTGMRFMAWDRSPEAVMRLSMRLLAGHGIRRIQIAEPSNDVAAARRVAAMAREEGIAEVVAAVVFTESPVHTDDRFAETARALDAVAEIDTVYLKDPGGLLTVDRARALIPQVRAAVSGTLELHGHGTAGMADQVYVEAAELGVDVLHTGTGALADGSAQPEARRLVANLEARGIGVAIDIDAVSVAAATIDTIARSQGLEPGRPYPLDLTVHRHQVPGGMMGTLRRQLDEIGHPERLPQVLAEVATVRRELGWPIMVTPYSQFVGTQAVLNVIGGARWERIPDEVIRYVLGHFGQPPGDIADHVRDRVEVSARTARLAEVGEEPSLDQLRDTVERRLGRAVTDEELVLRAVLPDEQVDAMIDAGPAPLWQPSELGPATGPNLARIIAAIEDLPRWRRLQIRRGDAVIDLRRSCTRDSR
jgi:oxaloacetate decarboxylase alpha subunit